jgi:hypothetical protein
MAMEVAGMTMELAGMTMEIGANRWNLGRIDESWRNRRKFEGVNGSSAFQAALRETGSFRGRRETDVFFRVTTDDTRDRPTRYLATHFNDL